VRKFKDANGEYLFAMSNNAGEMGNLVGYPIIEMPDMPNVGANAFPVAFGNFNEGYLAVDRTELRITVDDNITTPGYVKWYVRRRFGGIVKNDDAIKLIKCATS
jgi:HK97 family phage major capsid protein